MIAALFRIDIEDSSFALWQTGMIVQYLTICQWCCNQCWDVKSLLRFRLACRSTEITQSRYCWIVYPYYLRRRTIGIGRLYQCVLQFSIRPAWDAYWPAFPFGVDVSCAYVRQNMSRLFVFFAAVKRLIINAVRRNVQSVCKRILAQMTNFIAYFWNTQDKVLYRAVSKNNINRLWQEFLWTTNCLEEACMFQKRGRRIQLLPTRRWPM